MRPLLELWGLPWNSGPAFILFYRPGGPEGAVLLRVWQQNGSRVFFFTLPTTGRLPVSSSFILQVSLLRLGLWGDVGAALHTGQSHTPLTEPHPGRFPGASCQCRLLSESIAQWAGLIQTPSVIKNLVLGVEVPLRHKVPHSARCFSCISLFSTETGFSFFLFFLNWSVVDVQYFVNYFCTAEWFSYTYTRTYTLFFIFFSIMVNHRILNIVLCAIQWDLVYPFYV